MPKIATYDAPEGLGLRPTETGITAVAAAARRVQGEYNEVAAAQQGTGERIGSSIRVAGDIGVKYLEHRDISQGAPALAGLMAAKTKQWEDALKTADPNDPVIADKYREGLEVDLEKFKTGFMTEAGQKWAQTHTDQFRQHMFNKTAGDMSNLAKMATAINVRQLENNLSAGLQSDPSEANLRNSIGMLDGSIGALVDSSPNLTGTAAHKIELTQTSKEKLVKAAAIAHIQKTAEVPGWVKKKEFADYVNGPELTIFEKAAQSQKKQDFLQQKLIEKHVRDTTVQTGKDELARNFTDNVSFDDNGTPRINPRLLQQSVDVTRKYKGSDGVPIDEIVKDAKSYINWTQAQLREKREIIVNNSAIQSALYDGLFRTENPTTEVDILNANANPDPTKRIDDHTTKTLLNLHKAMEERPLKGPMYHSAMEAVKEKLGANVVADGHTRYNNFMGQFIPAYLALPEKDRIGALDVSNPNSLISKIIGTEPGQGLRPTPAQLMMGKYLKNLGIGVEATPETLQKLNTLDPGAAAPLPAATLPAIPPAAQRHVGRIYQTPAGPRVWRGTGWEVPK